MSIFGAIGSIVGGIFGNKQAKAELAFQKDLARKRIRWTAYDARQAGIHPLAALGAGYPSYSPVGDGGLGAAIANAGAHLGDAVQGAKGSSLQKRVVESEIAVNEAQVDALRAQAVSGIAEAQAVVKGGAARMSTAPGPQTTGINEGNPVAAADGIRQLSAGEHYVRTPEGNLVPSMDSPAAVDFDTLMTTEAVKSTAITRFNDLVGDNLGHWLGEIKRRAVRDWRSAWSTYKKVAKQAGLSDKQIVETFTTLVSGIPSGSGKPPGFRTKQGAKY